MGTVTEIRNLFQNEARSVAGFYFAARAKHWIPTLFWTLLSLVVSAACIFGMLNAWEQYVKHNTIVDVSVKNNYLAVASMHTSTLQGGETSLLAIDKPNYTLDDKWAF